LRNEEISGSAEEEVKEEDDDNAMNNIFNNTLADGAQGTAGRYSMKEEDSTIAEDMDFDANSMATATTSM